MELLNFTANVPIRCNNARGNLGGAAPARPCTRLLAVLVNLTREAESSLGSQLAETTRRRLHFVHASIGIVQRLPRRSSAVCSLSARPCCW